MIERVIKTWDYRMMPNKMLELVKMLVTSNRKEPVIM